MTDYVIVGAGSAGCILANRLSADPSVNVTLLEAGGADSSIFYRMPAGLLAIMKSGMGNWGYETVPQYGIDGKPMYFPRGKVLGGSGSINGQVFVRGNKRDFDNWAQSGARGWSFDEVLPYFKKMETHPDGASEYHGGDGPIRLTVAPPAEQMTPISQAWLRAASDAGYAINQDYNGAIQDGFAPCQVNYYNGVRQSTSSTYLRDAMTRPNLSVVTKAQATRVLIQAGRAVGIEYVQGGTLRRVNVEREVILCGGAVNSPQLLQLSGVGPGELLQRYGISVVQDLPGVGENLQDHAAVALKQKITKPYSALAYTRPVKAILGLAQYAMFGTGPTTSNGLELLAFITSRPELEVPDIQYHFVNMMYEDHGRRIIPHEGFMASANVARPGSRGHVRIASADPLAAPLIDPNYFSDPDDMRIMRESIRISRKLIADKAFDDFRGEEYGPGAGRDSDVELDDYIRSVAYSVYHPVGTCRMGGGSMSVVDEKLRVNGIDRLRVVDASVMPTITTGNTNAATMMIAEKAADLILEGNESITSDAAGLQPVAEINNSSSHLSQGNGAQAFGDCERPM
jgi:choline dehydrogenase